MMSDSLICQIFIVVEGDIGENDFTRVIFCLVVREGSEVDLIRTQGIFGLLAELVQDSFGWSCDDPHRLGRLLRSAAYNSDT